LIYDMTILIAGAVYFWKFRSTKRSIDSEIKKKSTNKAQNYTKNIIWNRLMDILIWISFAIFAARIYLKDIFFVALEFDKLYIMSCRCSD
jgi:hypothetical protein